MSDLSTVISELSVHEVAELSQFSEKIQYSDNQIIFTEGDLADCFYIIESGQVSIFVEKCGKDEPISILSAGDFFGEMAILNKDCRSASAMALGETSVQSIDKDRFLQFVKENPKLAAKIKSILTIRNEELLLVETMVGSTGVSGERFHVSIKGDPSLRESAFDRERYESVVDKHLDELIPVLEDLLLNRCVFKLFINFNSAEVRISSIMDPFREEIHTANKLVGKGYIERHFPVVSYRDKTDYIQRFYRNLMTDAVFSNLPEYFMAAFRRSHEEWQPLDKMDVIEVVQKLGELRSIQSFYLRNFGISVVQDAIRMQFNCDGTHFVSSDDYHKFLEENVI